MNTSRRKFLNGLGFVAASVAAISRLTDETQKAPKRTRLLAKDGSLVEVDLNHIPRKRMKATTSQVATWIWKKT